MTDVSLIACALVVQTNRFARLESMEMISKTLLNTKSLSCAAASYVLETSAADRAVDENTGLLNGARRGFRGSVNMVNLLMSRATPWQQ